MAASDHLSPDQFRSGTRIIPIEDVGRMQAYNWPGHTVEEWRQQHYKPRASTSTVATEGIQNELVTDKQYSVLLEGHHRYAEAVNAGHKLIPARPTTGPWNGVFPTYANGGHD